MTQNFSFQISELGTPYYFKKKKKIIVIDLLLLILLFSKQCSPMSGSYRYKRVLR